MRASSDEEVEAIIEKKHWPQMNAETPGRIVPCFME
jgi:hypothetical protein